MKYFNFYKNKMFDPISLRKCRSKMNGFSKVYKFDVGDIVKIVYQKKTVVFLFEGICLAVFKSSFSISDVSFVLSNLVLGVIIEMKVSFFYNRLYNLILMDYKSKFKSFRKNRLYFMSNTVNKNSLMK